MTGRFNYAVLCCEASLPRISARAQRGRSQQRRAFDLDLDACLVSQDAPTCFWTLLLSRDALKCF